jgi:hypothetical protein
MEQELSPKRFTLSFTLGEIFAYPRELCVLDQLAVRTVQQLHIV